VVFFGRNAWVLAVLLVGVMFGATVAGLVVGGAMSVRSTSSMHGPSLAGG
jgi:hypothetical protein